MPKKNHAASTNDKIMIVGGYGKVGMAITKYLAPDFPSRIIVAGRNLSKADAAAKKIGHFAAGRAIDIFADDTTDALAGVGLVLVCLDQSDTRFAQTCLARAIHYVDISSDYKFLLQVEGLNDLAVQNDATAILSVGVAPGLSNLMAASPIAKWKKPNVSTSWWNLALATIVEKPHWNGCLTISTPNLNCLKMGHPKKSKVSP